MLKKLKKSYADHTDIWYLGILVFLLIVSVLVYGFGFTALLWFTPALLAGIFAIMFLRWDEKPNIKLQIAGLIFATTFVLEIVGVNTGVLFGHYSYGSLLGFKLFGVPVIIGLVWFIVTFSVWQIVLVSGLKKIYEQLVLGVMVVILFDLLLEQFAVSVGLWQWRGGHIPLLNYICWAGLSTAIFLIYKYKSPNIKPNIFSSSIVPILSIWLWLMLVAGSL